MKILASSRTIANCLKKLNLDHNWVNEVELINHDLHVKTNSSEVIIYVEGIENDGKLLQVDARWDWVCQTLGLVEEQPVVLEIRKTSINVIFQY